MWRHIISDPLPPFVTLRHKCLTPSPLSAWRHLWTAPYPYYYYYTIPHFTFSAFYRNPIGILPYPHFTLSAFYTIRILPIRILPIRILPIRILPYTHFTLIRILPLSAFYPYPHFTQSEFYFFSLSRSPPLPHQQLGGLGERWEREGRGRRDEPPC